MSDNCRSCGRLLNQPNDPLSDDCGGDCLQCMEAAGDPDCKTAQTPVFHKDHEQQIGFDPRTAEHEKGCVE